MTASLPDSVRTQYLIGIRVWFCLLALVLPAAAQWRTGYFQQGQTAGQTAVTIPWSKYTHVIHYALRPTYNNGVCGLDTSEGLLRAADIEEFVNDAHAAGVKAIIGIREDDSLDAITACTAPQNIAQFVEQIRMFVANSGYDGVDLDWEGGIIAPQYQDLIRRLRTAMPTATLSVVVGIAERLMTAAIQYDLDQINIRTYELDSQDRTGSALNYAWYHSPTLQGANTQYQAMAILSWYYMYAGNASSKLGLVVPLCGRIRKGCLNDTGTKGVTDPNQTWNRGAWTAYLGPDQLQEVVALIKGNGLGGIATYGLPYEYSSTQDGDDRYPLSTAMYDAMMATASAPVISKTSPLAATPVSLLSGNKELLLAKRATPPSIVTTSPLPTALTGAVYARSLVASGTAPITWTVTSGTLPAGLTLGSSTGIISGTPTAAGVFILTVRAQNAGGSNSKQLGLTVNAPAAPPSSLWTAIASDMSGKNEGYPHGVPLSWDWPNGPVVLMGNNPNGWQALTGWGVVYEAAQGNPAKNVRVNLRKFQTYFLQKSSGKWLLLQNTSTPAGESYLEDFSGDINKPGDVRKEPDGTISVTAGGGYNFHFYPADRAGIDPNDVGGLLVIVQARLIVADPAKPDDRSIARYLCGSGADYYPALKGGWPGNTSYNPGVGIGKEKYVQNNWRFLATTTLTADQLQNNPPPVDLTGIAQ